MQIRSIDAATDADACDLVIASLPYFFAQAAGIADCADAVRTQRGFVAEGEKGIAGFITLERRFPETVEITWFAVHREHRRSGVGRLLVEHAITDARELGARLVILETVGPSEPEPDVAPGEGYDGTRAFYARLGFLPVEEVRLEGWTDRAVLLARPL